MKIPPKPIKSIKPIEDEKNSCEMLDDSKIRELLPFDYLKILPYLNISKTPLKI